MDGVVGVFRSFLFVRFFSFVSPILFRAHASGVILVIATRLKFPSRAYDSLERTAVLFDFEEVYNEVVKGNWDIDMDMAIQYACLFGWFFVFFLSVFFRLFVRSLLLL
jgi:hypothetical protein